MKKIIIIGLIFLFASCVGHPKHSVIPKGATVLILGDSLSYGTGANPGQDYPSLLALSTGWHIINAGIPGNVTAQGLERLPALIEEYQPSLLLVELGGNDFLHQTPISLTEAHLKQILNYAKAKGIKTLLIAIPEFSQLMAAFGHLSDHPLYAKLAKENEVALIENVFSAVLSDKALKADPIHPNAQGYALVANKMQSALKDLGYTE